jgi:hypothetical protein
MRTSTLDAVNIFLMLASALVSFFYSLRIISVFVRRSRAAALCDRNFLVARETIFFSSGAAVRMAAGVWCGAHTPYAHRSSG